MKVRYPNQEVPISTYNEDSIVIGRIINATPESYAKLARSDLYKHILIAGTTGSGKSYTASKIGERVAKNFRHSVVIFDWHGEYPSLLLDYDLIDPYARPIPLFTNDPDDISVIASVMDLTPPQEYLLDKILRRVDLRRIRIIESLLDYIESYPEESSWMRETKLSLHRKLSPLLKERYSDLFKLHGDGDKDVVISSQEGRPTILNLSSIHDPNIRRLYASFFLKRLVEAMMRQNKRVLIILEESHNYLSKNRPITHICNLLREIRKFGIGLVVISQSLSSLVDDVAINTNTKIIHALKSKQDLEVVENSMYLSKELLELIPYMEPGEAAYSTPILKKPVLIKVE